MLDTNVVVSAVLWGGAPAALLRAVRTRPDVLFFTSEDLVQELGQVLERAHLAAALARRGRSVAELVADYRLAAEVLRIEPLAARTAPDPDDDIVLATAAAARADLVVTGDRMLLAVSRFGEAQLVTVAAAMQRIQPHPR